MSKGLTITLVTATLVLTVAVAGIGAYVFLFQPTAAAEGAAHTEEPVEAAHAEAFYLQPAAFLTNLADKERLRYINVSIALALKDEAALESAKKIEPQLRDVVLDHLRQKVAADFAGAEGKAKLAETLQAGLTQILKGSLTKVYVTDLVVQ
jgi:flagellar protein FliL